MTKPSCSRGMVFPLVLFPKVMPWEKKDHYVYELAYPEIMGGQVFYVGKGKGNRINAHEYEARQGVKSLKCAIIRSILACGEQVVKKKIAENITERQAFCIERHNIRWYGLDTLTNQIAGGHRGSKYKRSISKALIVWQPLSA